MPSSVTGMSVAEYSDRWLAAIQPPVVRRRTWKSYSDSMRLHILPALGARSIGELTRAEVRALLAAKFAASLSRNTVRIIHATLRAMLYAALEDGLITVNPAARLGRAWRSLAPTPANGDERSRAMSAAELERLLRTARRMAPRWYPLLLVLARAGLRIGEAIALRWDDVNFDQRLLRVERGISKGEIGPTKGGRARDVDMSRQLEATLHSLSRHRRAPWIFPTSSGRPVDYWASAWAFARARRAAGLPPHLSLHSLRHTFASLLLQHGESVEYVRRQLGHASIALTVGTYGRWLPMSNHAAVDRLDSPGPATRRPPTRMTGRGEPPSGGRYLRVRPRPS